MKRIFTIRQLVPMLLLLTLMSCSSDDNEATQDDQPVVGNVEQMAASGDVSAFFASEYPWTGSMHFFDGDLPLDGRYKEELCMRVDSKEELADIYVGSLPLPEIDFSKATLVIGRTFGFVPDPRMKYVGQTLCDSVSFYSLGIQCQSPDSPYGFQGMVGSFHYWGLYEKLADKPLKVYFTKETEE